MTRRKVEVAAASLRKGDRIVRVGAETHGDIHTWVVSRKGEAIRTDLGEAWA